MFQPTHVVSEPPPMLAGEDVGNRGCTAEPPPKWGWTRGALWARYGREVESAS